MFDTPEFRVMLMKALTVAVTARSLINYDSAIVDKLQEIAISVSKTSGGDIEASGDTTPKEIRSATTIAEDAATIAQGAGRLYILWEDIQSAIELRFCTVFPFCKSEKP
jgi:hypothetical protein